MNVFQCIAQQFEHLRQLRQYDRIYAVDYFKECQKLVNILDKIVDAAIEARNKSELITVIDVEFERMKNEV